MNSSDLVMVGSYNHGLVALSILTAMLESYAIIDLAGRVRANRGGRMNARHNRASIFLASALLAASFSASDIL